MNRMQVYIIYKIIKNSFNMHLFNNQNIPTLNVFKFQTFKFIFILFFAIYLRFIIQYIVLAILLNYV